MGIRYLDHRVHLGGDQAFRLSMVGGVLHSSAPSHGTDTGRLEASAQGPDGSQSSTSSLPGRFAITGPAVTVPGCTGRLLTVPAGQLTRERRTVRARLMGGMGNGDPPEADDLRPDALEFDNVIRRGEAANVSLC